MNFASKCYFSPLPTYHMPKKWVGVYRQEARGVKPGPERAGGRSKFTQQVWCPGIAARPMPGRPRPLPGRQLVLQGWS